jgi:hypothetical protein
MVVIGVVITVVVFSEPEQKPGVSDFGVSVTLLMVAPINNVNSKIMAARTPTKAP